MPLIESLQSPMLTILISVALLLLNTVMRVVLNKHLEVIEIVLLVVKIAVTPIGPPVIPVSS